MLLTARFRCVCLLAILVTAPGCAAIARHLAIAMAKQHVSRTFTVMGGSVAAFRQCLKSAGGDCGGTAERSRRAFVAGTAQQPLTTDLAHLHAARAGARGTSESASAERRTSEPTAAERALSHPVQQRLNALYNQLAGLGGDQKQLAVSPRKAGAGEELALHFQVSEIDEYVRLIAEATEADDWGRLSTAATASARASWDATLLAYVSTYVNAYFRGGRFLKLSGTAQSELTDSLKKRFPFLSDGELRSLFPDFFKDGLFGGVGGDGFVTRGGASYQFPTVEARIDPVAGHITRASDVELPVVAADLTRVVLEAIFDAHDQLPAVSTATGTSIDADHNGLKVHDPAKSKVSADDFAEVNRISNQAEAAVSSIVTPAIRGAGWGSLNNEALAKLIETLVSVTVRKVTEKAAWCWYACGSTTSEARVSAEPDRVELTLEIDS